MTISIDNEMEAIVVHPCQHTGCVCENFSMAELQLLPPETCNGCSHGWGVHGMLVMPNNVPDQIPPTPPRASWRDRLDAARPARPAATAAEPADSTFSSPVRLTASAAASASASAESPGSSMSQILARMRASPAAAQATGVAVKARSPYAPNNT